jgi:uncharacterized repeat protein (TIGR03803 family)
MNPNSPLRSAVGLLVFVIVFVIVILGWPPAARATGKEQVLYSFQGIPDGSIPVGGVVIDASGNLYGATTDGGSSSCGGIAQCGTVYQLQPPSQQGGAWTESILYVFQGLAFGDGETPAGGVILDKAGNLYGTTAYGGAGDCILLGGDVGCGTVYELTPPTSQGGAWTETVIYSFQGGNDGYLPMGNLVFDSAGNLYGATYYGGGFGVCNQGIYPYCGTIFKLSPPKTKGGVWKEKVLYSFKSGTDGANPNGSLVLDRKGALYGTTFFGGNQGCAQVSGVGCGTVFKLSPPAKQRHAWKYQVLHRFNEAALQGHSDGENPAAGVILDQKGTLYGTTARGGGEVGEGTAFVLAPQVESDRPWKETILHVFSGLDGWNPLGLILDARGNLYGGASIEGAYGDGTIFRLKPPIKPGRPWVFTILYSFMGSPDGIFPAGSLILDNSHNLFGVTQQGGSESCQQGGCGTVFEFTP